MTLQLNTIGKMVLAGSAFGAAASTVSATTKALDRTSDKGIMPNLIRIGGFAGAVGAYAGGLALGIQGIEKLGGKTNLALGVGAMVGAAALALLPGFVAEARG